MSPAGEAFAMLPPSVPRFWIWAAPIVPAASTSAGRCSRHRADRRMSVYVVSAPSVRPSPSAAMPRSSSSRHRSTVRAGGSPSSPVSATSRSVPPATGRADRRLRHRDIGVREGRRARDGRFDGHGGAYSRPRRRRAANRSSRPATIPKPAASWLGVKATVWSRGTAPASEASPGVVADRCRPDATLRHVDRRVRARAVGRHRDPVRVVAHVRPPFGGARRARSRR